MLAVILSRYHSPHCPGFDRTSSPSVFAQLRPVPADTEVREALARFIRAFDDLDWEHFRMAFDDNATVFYPRVVPQRANGRAEFEKAFKTVFQQIRSGKTAALTWTSNQEK